MNRAELKKAVCAAIDKNRDKIYAFGDAIAKEPELGYKEYKTAEKWQKLLDEMGLPHRDNVALTGVVTEIPGADHKARVAVMAELDAVITPTHPAADPLTGAAHACGHNAMMAALAGVAYAFREPEIMASLDGDVVLMAVPAEEFVELEFRNKLREEGKISFLGGKQEFLKLGEFDNIDAAIMQHTAQAAPGFKAGAGSVCNGFAGRLVRYVGKEAHAGAAPWEGVNALNAAMLGLMGVHAQRETFKDDDHIRVHPIITKGGDLVNVVPAEVRLESYIRGSNTEAIMDAAVKVDRALKAGADAVGAKCEITELPGYLPANLNDDLMDIMVGKLKELCGDECSKLCAGFGGGSSDQGDLSQVLPSMQAFFAGATGGFHSENFCLADKETAYIMAAKGLAMTVVDLLADGAADCLRVKENFTPILTKEQYLREWGGLEI